jgi:twitching motility two-component system response regulator PilH
MANKKILLVDDSDTALMMGLLVLKKGAYDVIVARDGEEGIEKAVAERPDLILMDVVMPGINGYQATRTITRDEATRAIPVIMCTSKGLETDKIWGMRQGAHDYLVKPVNLPDLLTRIKAMG